MKIRKVAIGVVFRKSAGGIKFLVLRRKQGWKGWELPKGGVDKGETFAEAALREVEEETGLRRLKLIKPVKGKIIYNYPKQYSKKHGFAGTVQRAFLVETSDSKVNIEKDVFAGFAWLDGKDAINRLKWDNQRKLVRLILKGRWQKYS